MYNCQLSNLTLKRKAGKANNDENLEDLENCGFKPYSQLLSPYNFPKCIIKEG